MQWAFQRQGSVAKANKITGRSVYKSIISSRDKTAQGTEQLTFWIKTRMVDRVVVQARKFNAWKVNVVEKQP